LYHTHRCFSPTCLLLLDWELPGATGTELVAGVRQAAPGVRIIALSSRPEARYVALESGVDAFVSKGTHPIACYLQSGGCLWWGEASVVIIPHPRQPPAPLPCSIP
jgi:hypothetical protein